MLGAKAGLFAAIVVLGMVAECYGQEYVVAPTSVPYAYPTAGGYYPGGVYPGGVYGGAHHGYGGGYAPAMHGSGQLVPLPKPKKSPKPPKSPDLSKGGLGSGENLAVVIPRFSKQITTGAGLAQSALGSDTLWKGLAGVIGLIG